MYKRQSTPAHKGTANTRNVSETTWRSIINQIPMSMMNLIYIKRLKLLIAAVFIVAMTACGEEDEQMVPLPQNISEAYLDSCVSGKGWTLMASHEIKPNGTLEKTDYQSAPDAAKPQQYFFTGDTLTTFLSTEAYSIDVYRKSYYTYNPATHKVETPEGEAFKVISVSPDELCVVQYKGFSGNGTQILVYSVYRPMNAGELALCRRNHPYNIATLNHEYPVLPEQMFITPADFKLKAVGQGWLRTAAYRMETTNRYSAVNLHATGGATAPEGIYLTADSLFAISHNDLSGFSLGKSLKYNFRANSYSLETPIGTGLRLLSLSADEMRLLVPPATDDGQTGNGMYCVYRRMNSGETALVDSGFDSDPH